ncbi:MAG: VCBS repeat-containing protein [Anaerolineales bacterium]|nr:VCBS repeat-containing protein [Anaerolineales bacterium]
MKFVKKLLTLILLLAALPVFVVQAEGGIAVQPYWIFPTDAPVTHIQTGDINGDGVPEVVMTTADGWLYVLENDSRVAWRYKLGTVANDLMVGDMDGDQQTAEIFVAGRSQNVLLSNTQRPVWSLNLTQSMISSSAASAADLDGDGRQEILLGHSYFLAALDSETGISRYVGPQNWQSVLDIWVGEVEGDSRPEVVPSIAEYNQVYVLDKNLKIVWQRSFESVGLVQGGDVDGDGQAEIAVLDASWDLFLLESDGKQVWHNQNLTGLPDLSGLAPPTSGQMIVHDLEGDGRMEIIVLTPGPAAVHVFKGDGSLLWQHLLGPKPNQDMPGQTSKISKISDVLGTATLTAADMNGDGQAEVVAKVAGQGQVYLLDAAGRRLATYLVQGSTGTLGYADLNGDGQGEIMIGTETGLQVFGASAQVQQRELGRWLPFLGGVNALDLVDLDGDGRLEVLAGSQEGQVYALTAEGQILWKVDLKTMPGLGRWVIPTVLALSVGDVDGDGQPEVAVAGSSQIYLMNSHGPRWAVPVREQFTTIVAIYDLEGDGQAEIITGGNLNSGGGIVGRLDGAGKLVWQRELAEPVRTVGSDRGQILIGTGNGRVYRLTAAGAPAGEYELGAKVLSFGAGQAITEDGQVYRLDDSGSTLVGDLGAAPRLARLSAGATAMLTREGEVSLTAGDGSRWQETVAERALSLAAGDINGDGQVAVAVGTNDGQVHLFGSAVNQPPLLTNPDLTETRNGYTYSIEVNDPDEDIVIVTLEIWDPSAGLWLTQATQRVEQGQGRLNLNVSDPFDTWDSGQESRFRFGYDDGYNQGLLAEVPGPFSIPTLPWYLYYGQWAGLGALALLVPALGWALYRRQQVYHRSPIGRAESLLRQLRSHPDEALPRLYDLARDEPALLAYLPGLARDVGESLIADVSEGFNLILTRPEVVGEGLRAAVRGGGEVGSRENELEGSIENPRLSDRQSKIQKLYGLCLEALEANTVSRIVALRPRLEGFQETTLEASLPSPIPGQEDSIMAELGLVAQILHNYERVETVEDKVAYLAQALETLGRLDREFQITLAQPERNIFTRIALNWLGVTTNALEDVQGRAQIEVSLKTRRIFTREQTTLAMELTNTGRSPASNLTVTLMPDQVYAVGNGAACLELLPAGRSAVVELPVSAAASLEQFRAEFIITFDDRERGGKSVAFADVVRLLKPAEFRPVPNPYAPGTPLRPGSTLFFGRDDLFQFMAENLGGATRQNILVLIGQRRMGKTSFLQQLSVRLGQTYLPVYLDGQSLGIDPGMANFFYDLSLAIADALADQGCAIAEPVLAEFQERPSGVFERIFLPAVFEAIGSRRLLLLFDEFEELEMRVASGKLEATIFPFFRHLMQHAEKVGFVFVGTHRLEELTTDYWSILFNIALYKRVTFLGEAAAKALIVEPVAQSGLLYDDLALDKIIRVTAGHPYFLQLICHALVNRANREARNYLTIRDVNDTLLELVELGEAHFAFLWEQSSPTEQLILAALMRLLARTPTVTTTQIAELLAERGRSLELQVVRDALRRLTERDVVRELGESPPHYEYKVDLVRLWVERYKALGRVIEELSS